MIPAFKFGVDARVLGQRGVGRYLSNLLQGMARQKGAWQATLFVNTRSRLELAPRDPRFILHDLGGANPAWAEQRLIPRLALELGLDLIHYPDNSGCVNPPLPTVVTLHDGMWRRPLREALLHPTLRQRVQDAYRKWVCPRAARAAAALITVSDFSKRELLAGLPGLVPEKLRVIHEGLDPVFNRPLARAVVAAGLKGLGLSQPYLLCSGAADRRKNIDRLIEAFAQARLPGVQLVVTSLRPGEQATTSYERSVEKFGLQGRVRFLGYVTDHQMQALYQGALCYAFPSLWEGFGLPLLEAFACGTPVLAARAGALPEVAGKAALLVDPLDIEALSSGLKRLARARREPRAAKGYAQLKRFSWDKAAKETLQLYAEVAKRGAGA